MTQKAEGIEVTLRLDQEVYDTLQERCQSQGMGLTEWMEWAIAAKLCGQNSSLLSLEQWIEQVNTKLHTLLQRRDRTSPMGSLEVEIDTLKRENHYLREALAIADRHQALLQQTLGTHQQTLPALEQEKQHLHNQLKEMGQTLVNQEVQLQILQKALSESQKYAQQLEKAIAQLREESNPAGSWEHQPRPQPQSLLPEELAQQLGLSVPEIFQRWRSGKLEGWHLGRDQRFYAVRLPLVRTDPYHR